MARQESEKKKGFLSSAKGRVAAGVIAGTLAFGGFAVYQASQNENQPNSSPIPSGTVEPSKSPTPTPFPTENPTIIPSPTPEVSPTLIPTPEATSKPEYAFPGDLKSWINEQIHAENSFSGYSGSKEKLPLNTFYDTIQNINIPENGAEFNLIDVQGYELGAEIIDGHLINYFGLKDKKGNQFFFPVNYGRVESNDKAYYYNPRIATAESSAGGGDFISIKELQRKLAINMNNEIIFSITSYVSLPTTIEIRDREELFAQSSIAQKLMKWILKTKNSSYENIPMDPELAKIINKRVTHFNPTLIPEANSAMPFKKP